MPDIDIDFCQRRRDEVIDYVRDLYGEDSVSQIATFNILKAKSAVRDVGRVMGMPFGDVDRLVVALDTLLGDADLRRSLGEAGRARLLERFTFDRFRDRLEGYLRELLPRD